MVAFAHDEPEHSNARRLSEVAESYDVLRLPAWRNRIKAGLAFAGSTPLTHVLLDHPRARAVLATRVASFKPDVVLAFCSGMARFALEPPLAGLPLVLDMVDVDSMKWRELGATASWPRKLVYDREARCLADFERTACSRASSVAVISGREAQLLAEIGAGAPIVVPNGVDVQYFRRPDTMPRKARVVFTAIFDYPPNEAGALWTIEHVWPKVVRSNPDAELILAGARPTRALRHAASRSARVIVTGAVEDIRPYLWEASVAIAPLQVARGTQNKVLEAAAAGLRSVVTSAVMSGLPEPVGSWCTVAPDAERFADAIVEVLQQSGGNPGISLEVIGWERCLAPLLDALRRARA